MIFVVKEIVDKIREAELNSEMAEKNAHEKAKLDITRAQEKALKLASERISRAKASALQDLNIAEQRVIEYKSELDSAEKLEIQRITDKANERQEEAIKTLINAIV